MSSLALLILLSGCADAAARSSPGASRVFAYLRAAPRHARSALVHSFSDSGSPIPSQEGLPEARRLAASDRDYEAFVAGLEARYEADPKTQLLSMVRSLALLEVAFRHSGKVDPSELAETATAARAELDAAQREEILAFTRRIARAFWNRDEPDRTEAVAAAVPDETLREFRLLLFERDRQAPHAREAIASYLDRRPRLAPHLIARAGEDQTVRQALSLAVKNELVSNMADAARSPKVAERMAAIAYLERWLDVDEFDPPVWQGLARALEELAHVSVQGDRLLAKLSRIPGGPDLFDKAVSGRTFARLVTHARFRSEFLASPRSSAGAERVNDFRRILLELDHWRPDGPEREPAYLAALDALKLAEGLAAVGVVNTLADFLYRPPTLSDAVWDKLVATIEGLGLSHETLALLRRVPPEHRRRAVSPLWTSWLDPS